MKNRFLTLFALLPLGAASSVMAQSTFLNSADGGNWGTGANWNTNPVIPNAIDAEAIVNGAGVSGSLDVQLDGIFTIGKLTRTTDGGVAATFPTTPTTMDATKGLTLQTTSGQPLISVVGNVFYYSAFFGNQGFEKAGNGRFTLRFNTIDQSFTGPIKISAGTLGIEKDRSLGDVNNDLEIAANAKLFAEPGANAGLITLPATRSITLTGAGQLGSNNPAVNLLIEGPISDGGSGFAPVKTDIGVVTLAGTNNWTGGVAVNAGVLLATRPEAFPGYGSQIYTATGSSVLGIRYGDGSPLWTGTEINDLLFNAMLNDTSSFGLDTTGNTSDADFALDLPATYAVTRVAKTGPGKVTLSASPGLDRLTMYEGTLALGAASTPAPGVTLVFQRSGAVLDLGGTSASATALTHVNGGTSTVANGTLTLPDTASFNATAANTVLSLPGTTATIGRVQPFSGNTTTINGAGGSLTVQGDFNFDVNGANNTRLVMGALGSFTFNRANRAFRCLPVTAATDTTNELVLAGSNLVTANLVQVGGASGSSQGNAHQGQLRLGTTNEFRTPVFQVGGFNGSGVVTFQASLINPVFKVRGADGTSPVPSLKIGETSSGVRSGAGTLNLTDGSGDISATEVVLARHIANASNGNTSSLTLPDGSLTATTLRLVQKQGAGSPLLLGVVTQSGGTVTVDDLIMVETIDGTAPNVASATQNLQATYNLDGGTLAAGEIKPGTLATPITAGTTQRNLILRSGTLTNVPAGDLDISGVTMVVSGLSSTVLENTPGQEVNLAASTTYSARMNSANGTAGMLTVLGTLDLTASPAFFIFDDAPGDATALPPGTELVLIDYQNGTLNGTFAGLPDGATVNVTKGTVTNSFILDYNDPDHGGKAVTLTIPSGGGYADWADDNGIPGADFDDDTDNDGIANGVEYGLGTNPLVSTQPAGVLSGNSISFTKGTDAITNGDVSWVIETSTTLAPGSWTPEVTQAPGDPAASISYVFTPGSPEKKFARLKVLQQP